MSQWRRRNVLAGGLATLLPMTGCSRGSDKPLPPPAEGALRLGTFNVHYVIMTRPDANWGLNDWERRRSSAANAVRDLGADLIAFQEMESFAGGHSTDTNVQRDWLISQMDGYAVAASGPAAQFPNTQPIFYRTARLDMLNQGFFFFSNTPEEIYSPTFDGGYPAFCSWARFLDRAGGNAFTVFNIHTDFASKSNQRKSADLVAERAAPLIAANEAVFVIGDLNAPVTSSVAMILRNAGLTFIPVRGSTYHWRRGLNLTRAVDHFAFSPGVETEEDAMVLRRRYDGIWPSDHYPVAADFRL